MKVIAESSLVSEEAAGVALVVDDEPGTRAAIARALKLIGFDVRTADSGAAGVALARGCALDLMLIDMRMPDMAGTEVVRLLREEGSDVPFIIMSGCLSTESVVESMKLGAFDVIEKPVSVDGLQAVALSAVAERRPLALRPAHAPAAGSRPRSAAERWAMLVLKACESEGDLKTLEDWATCAGLSYSSLRESCRMIGIRPHAARNLVRVLRAVMESALKRCPPGVLLDVSDTRTLERILARAGIPQDASPGSVSVEQFLRSQRFVAPDNEGLRVLETLLTPVRLQR